MIRGDLIHVRISAYAEDYYDLRHKLIDIVDELEATRMYRIEHPNVVCEMQEVENQEALQL